MAGYIGSGAALQIEGVLNKLQVSGKSGTAVTVGVMVLFLWCKKNFFKVTGSIEHHLAGKGLAKARMA